LAFEGNKFNETENVIFSVLILILLLFEGIKRDAFYLGCLISLFVVKALKFQNEAVALNSDSNPLS
jgi:hypothetical protein